MLRGIHMVEVALVLRITLVDSCSDAVFSDTGENTRQLFSGVQTPTFETIIWASMTSSSIYE